MREIAASERLVLRVVPDAGAWIRPAVIVAGLVLAEAVVVLGLLGLGNHPILGGDGPSYQRYAINLVDHGIFSDAAQPPYFPSVLRTPGYPLFLAFFRLLSPNSLLLVRLAQFVLLAATSLLVYSLGRKLVSEPAGVIAGVLCATYLPLIWLATAHLSELLGTFLVVVTVWLIVHAGTADRHVLGAYASVGAAAAILALVRPEYCVVIAPIAAAVLWFDRRGSTRERVGRVAVLLVACGLVMTPWTIRNASVGHRFIPFGVNSGQSLYVSAEQYAGRISYELKPAEYVRLYSRSGVFARLTAPAEQRVRLAQPQPGVALGTRLELADNDAVQAAAWREFRKLTVGQVVRSLPSRVVYLWGTGDYPPARRSFTVAAHRLAQLQWVLIVALMLIGLVVALRRLRFRAWPLLLFPAYITALHLVFHGNPRYTVPSRPLLMIFAAAGLVWIARRIRLSRLFGGGRSVAHDT